MNVQGLENPMLRIHVSKVVLNIGVGKSGEPIERAKQVLKQITGREPIETKAKQSIRDFGTHEGEPIGVKITLMGDEAIQLLKRLLIVKGLKLPASCFDEEGNFSFGIKEHIEIQGAKYDPEVGIFGLDVSVRLERPGYRVARRARCPSKVGKKHKVRKENTIEFVKKNFNVEVV